MIKLHVNTCKHLILKTKVKHSQFLENVLLTSMTMQVIKKQTFSNFENSP